MRERKEKPALNYGNCSSNTFGEHYIGEGD